MNGITIAENLDRKADNNSVVCGDLPTISRTYPKAVGNKHDPPVNEKLETEKPRTKITLYNELKTFIKGGNRHG